MQTILILLEAALLASALSFDTFIVSLAYGCKRIVIPPASVAVIDLTCSAVLGISLLLGSMVRPYIPHTWTDIICFVILFLLGMTKLLDGATKAFFRRHGQCDLCFSFCNLRFVLQVYADPDRADADNSKTISTTEAASLALALSLDGMAVGFGAAIGNVNGWAVVLVSLLIHAPLVTFGAWLGNRLSRTLRFNISWLSGAVLIFLALCKLF